MKSRSIRRLTAVLLLGMAASACGVDAEAEYTPATRRLSTSPALPRPQPTEVLPTHPEVRAPPPEGTVSVGLEPLGDSPLTVQARMVAVGAMTRVSARLSAGARGMTYEAAIRLGRCDRLGAQVANLNPITADTLGRGAATSDARVPLDRLLASEHVLVFGPRARPEACGDIPTAEAPDPD